jgi:hypothetical protein
LAEFAWGLVVLFAVTTVVLGWMLHMRIMRDREHSKSRTSVVDGMSSTDDQQNPSPPARSDNVAVSPPAAPEPVLPARIAVYSEGTSDPVLLVERAPRDLWETGGNLGLPDQGAAGLSAFLEQMPALATGGTALAHDLYVVQFSDASTLRLAWGDLKIQSAVGGGLRGVAVDSTGQIVENATLHSPGWLGAAAVGTFVWSAASILVGAKYLSDINLQLGRLAAGVADIKNMMSDQTDGWLLSSVERLQRHMADLQDQSFSQNKTQAVLVQVLSISHEAGTKWHANERELERTRAELIRLAGSSDFHTDQLGDAIALMEKLRRERRVQNAVAQIRAGSEHLCLALGEASKGAVPDLEATVPDVERGLIQDGTLGSVLAERVDRASRTWVQRWTLRGKDALETNRSKTTTLLAEMHQEVNGGATIQYVEDVATRLNEGFLGTTGPVRFPVRLDESRRVVEARQLAGV